MGTFLLKGFAIFWAIWIAWYLTGGPLRDDKTNPFVTSPNATSTRQPISR